MANATASRGDSASRDEELRAPRKLEDLKMVGETVSPFIHLEPEIYLDQAYAVLVILQGAWEDAAALTFDGKDLGQGVPYAASIGELNYSFQAEAMRAVSTLVALARHSCNVMGDIRDAAKAGRLA